MSALIWLCVAVGLWNPTSAGTVETGPEEIREIAFEDVPRIESGGDAPTPCRWETVFALPQEGVGQRLLSVVEELPPSTRFEIDAHDNRLGRVVEDSFALNVRHGARWHVRVALADRNYRVRAEALLPLTATPPVIAAAYLGGGGKHCTDDAVLQAVALEAKAKASDPLDLAFRLNEAVRARVSYVRDGRWDDAATVWRTGQGSCSEYHFLYAGLCRIAGLPCRFVGATAWRGEPGDASYVDQVYHRWSEVFLPGFGWFPVDVSRNDGEDGAPVNTAFGKTSRRLLVLSRGDGAEGDPLGTQYVATTKAVDAPARGVIKSERAIRWSAAEKALPPAAESR